MALFNKSIVIVSSVALALMCCVNAAWAKPADPRPKTFIQPDGTSITVKIRGDERCHYYLSEDDYLLMRDGDVFYYGVVGADGMLKASDVMAHQVQLRQKTETTFLSTINKSEVNSLLAAHTQQVVRRSQTTNLPGLFPGADFPNKGDQKVLIIIVSFADVNFTVDDPYDHFSRMLMEEGYSDYGATGSVYDYFIENSVGQFVPQFDVYGPVQLSHKCSYYGGNDFWGNDTNPHEMVIEACQALDDEIDFSQYDRNGDGYIDNVYVYYAGRGEASGGAANTIWPHSWEITSATSVPYIFDGVRLDRYACSNEWESGAPDGIGTFVHEFSHVMGLPDLYATSYTSAFTPGGWSAMDYGPYNNDGRTPPYYSAYERSSLGWLAPDELLQPANVSLPVISENKAYVIKTPDPNEYFLLENRQKQGWDKYIPGHGMLIWHIDYVPSVWTSNTVNNSQSHQYVDIEEADRSRSEGSRDGDAFPGTAGVTEFTSETSPGLRTWSGEAIDVPITDIMESKGLITFCVSGGVSNLDGVTLNEAENIKAGGFDLSWSADVNASKYLISIYTDVDTDGNINYVQDWARRDVGMVNSLTVTGLQPLTEYYCLVNSSNGRHISDDSNVIKVITGDPTFDYFKPSATDAIDIDATAFTATWEPMDDAISYALTVWEIGETVSNVDICDFTGGLSALPQGWATSSTNVFTNTAYCGNDKPAINMSANKTYVTSPEYPQPVDSISFWHRGSNAWSGNSLAVYAKVNGNYELVSKYSITNDFGGKTVVVKNMPAGTCAVKIEYDEKLHRGSVAVDDIIIYYGNYTPVEVTEGYDNLEVGNVLQYRVTGLKLATRYSYSVVATNGELLSLPSDPVDVFTWISGISDIVVEPVMKVSDNMIIVSAAPGDRVAVYDIMGRLVSMCVVAPDGLVALPLPASGIYLLQTNQYVSKIKI